MTLKHLQGFLGLTRILPEICPPLWKNCQAIDDLLKKNAFHWTQEAEQAFTELKQAMCTTPS
jgi:hypothetical protein